MTGAQWRFSVQYRAAAAARGHTRSLLAQDGSRDGIRAVSARRGATRPFKPFTARAAPRRAHEPDERPMLSDLKHLSAEQARAYLKVAKNDELAAALALAHDRNALDQSLSGRSGRAPDETEIHHALFLLRRALGQPAPSFDALRVALRARVRAA